MGGHNKACDFRKRAPSPARKLEPATWFGFVRPGPCPSPRFAHLAGGIGRMWLWEALLKLFMCLPA